ncbi:MAG: peptide deformylase [Lentisphaerae bacterium]|nr:peptide deformylase [Lentisphaerota bacterium]
MMKLKLCTYGNPVLREPAAPVAEITGKLKSLAEGMFEVMYAKKGLGLAAQQVGQTVQVCVIDVPPEADMDKQGGARLNPGVAMPLVMFNPALVEKRGSNNGSEGCLSVPELYAPVLRAEEVTVEYVDLAGERRRLTARGMLARAIQHEMDHLDGVLFVDRMSAIKKISLAGTLRRMKREMEERLGLGACPKGKY